MVDTVITAVMALVLAFLVEAFVEYLIGTPMDKNPAWQPYKWALMYVALVPAIFLSFYYKIDLLASFTGIDPSPVGFALTGMVISRGSNFVNDVIQKLRQRPDVSDVQG